jgi:hypothetical protein
MKRVIAIAAVVETLLVAALFHSDIKDFLWMHPWWLGILAALPGIAVPVLAWFELGHSGEANALRAEANEHLATANRLQVELDTERNTHLREIARLTAELDAERNKHLQQIADNTKKPVTQAEKNADILRKHLRATVTVSEGQGEWGANRPEIVEVGDDNIATLFVPRSYTSSTSWCVRVHCGDLEISDIPIGSCPLRLKVLKRYGPDIPLGEIARWEDRLRPAAAPVFAKGDSAYYATFGKPGSSEKRSLFIFTSKDGANSFLLEASTGETAIGDNVEISKRFLMMYVEYQAVGFNRSSAGTGVSPHRLFVSTV